jgi:hypothetical protein
MTASVWPQAMRRWCAVQLKSPSRQGLREHRL